MGLLSSSRRRPDQGSYQATRSNGTAGFNPIEDSPFAPFRIPAEGGGTFAQLVAQLSPARESRFPFPYSWPDAGRRDPFGGMGVSSPASAVSRGRAVAAQRAPVGTCNPRPPRNARPDAEIPVTPGLGPEIEINGRDCPRLKSMSQAEFEAYDKDYQALLKFGDEWAQAGPIGGVRPDDQVEMHAARAWDRYYKQRAAGKDPANSAAWAATAEMEAPRGYRQKQVKGPAQGEYQWEAPRRARFEQLFGIPFEQSTESQQFQFRDWELKNDEKAAADLIDDAKGPGEKAAAITLHYERPANKERRAKERAPVAEAIARRAQKVEELRRQRR